MGKEKASMKRKNRKESVHAKGHKSTAGKVKGVKSGRKKKCVYLKKIKEKKQKRKNYTKEDIQKALQAVSRGDSLRKAGSAYGVPAATLYRKIKTPDETDSNTGPDPILSVAQEKKIVNWIIYRSQTGSPITKHELLDSVQQYVTELNLDTPFKNNRPGRRWYENFRRRNPDISIRTAQNLTTTRANASEEEIREWFSQVESYLSSKDLLNLPPSRVFNCDETSIQFCPKPEKVLAKKGSSTVYKIVQPNEKECLTSLFMYGADGTRAPTLVLYPYQEKIPKKIVENCPKDFSLGASGSGWMTAETFYEYITLVFYPWIVKNKIDLPIIVYFDGHSSHMTMPLVSFCRDKNIVLISLYPNATHVIQPLDIAFFHPFKEIWRRFLAKWKNENKKNLTRENFATVLQLALDSYAKEKEAIIGGFQAAGLMPFNPNAPDYQILNKQKKKGRKEMNAIVEERKIHLQNFEKNIPVELLEEFKKNESNKLWTGAIEQSGLFNYWLSLKDENLGI